MEPEGLHAHKSPRLDPLRHLKAAENLAQYLLYILISSFLRLGLRNDLLNAGSLSKSIHSSFPPYTQAKYTAHRIKELAIC
jgi:hypothetical protein